MKMDMEKIMEFLQVFVKEVGLLSQEEDGHV
jgi:hypothetical protein